MKKTTNFSKQLTKYAALTVAMAGAADASGQIIYTDIDPDMGGDIQYNLDMDNNGVDDFNLLHIYNNLILNFNFSPPTGASFIGGNVSNGGAVGYPFALEEGDVIDGGDANWTTGFSYNILAYYSPLNGCQRANTEFCGVVGDKYLGLRFDIAGQTHYGWARLTGMQDSSVDWLIKDYAYNSTANEALNAGQMTLGVNDFSFEESIKVVALNKRIEISNLSSNVDYKLFSITGQQLFSGSIANDTHVIDANGIANGVYILELTDIDSNSRITKKVLL